VCRSIKTLRSSEGTASTDEVQAAALQFVRKVSGYRHPSKANQQVFDRAVDEIADVTRSLLDTLVVGPNHRQKNASIGVAESSQL
jgi:hypothetical protein